MEGEDKAEVLAVDNKLHTKESNYSWISLLNTIFSGPDEDLKKK